MKRSALVGATFGGASPPPAAAAVCAAPPPAPPLRSMGVFTARRGREGGRKPRDKEGYA